MHVTEFDVLAVNYKKKVDTSGEEILCAILYFENSDKNRFAELKEHAKNNYASKNTKYIRAVTSVQSQLLNYQHNYDSNRKSQYQGVRNLLMFDQNGKTGNGKHKKKRINEKSEEILTTSHAMIVEEKTTM